MTGEWTLRFCSTRRFLQLGTGKSLFCSEVRKRKHNPNPDIPKIGFIVSYWVQVQVHHKLYRSHSKRTFGPEENNAMLAIKVTTCCYACSCLILEEHLHVVEVQKSEIVMGTWCGDHAG